MDLEEWRGIATRRAERSKDPSTKVGAALFNRSDGGEWRLIGLACNQLVVGSPEAFWDHRSDKYDHVVHAEVGAILDAGSTSEGATLVVTHHPCLDCARLIAAAGIACVACPEGAWRDDEEARVSVLKAKAIFKRAKVEMKYV